MIHEFRLRGSLFDKYGGPHRIDVSDVREGIRALTANFGPGFRESIRTGEFHVSIDGREIDESEIEILLPRRGPAVVEIVPVVRGAGGNAANIGKIVLGLVLVVVGVVTQQYYLAAQGGLLMAAGVAGFFMAAPKTNMQQVGRPEDRPSFLFSQPTNTSSNGSAIPVVWGRRVRCGSVIATAGIQTSKVVAIGSSGSSSGSSSGGGTSGGKTVYGRGVIG